MIYLIYFQSRKVAQTSQLLREELRSAHTGEEIQRLTKQVEMENKLGNITHKINGLSLV